VLWSYAKSFEKIKYNYENKKIIFIRDDPNAIVSKLEQSKLLTLTKVKLDSGNSKCYNLAHEMQTR